MVIISIANCFPLPEASEWMDMNDPSTVILIHGSLLIVNVMIYDNHLS